MKGSRDLSRRVHRVLARLGAGPLMMLLMARLHVPAGQRGRSSVNSIFFADSALLNMLPVQGRPPLARPPRLSVLVSSLGRWSDTFQWSQTRLKVRRETEVGCRSGTSLSRAFVSFAPSSHHLRPSFRKS